MTSLKEPTVNLLQSPSSKYFLGYSSLHCIRRKILFVFIDMLNLLPSVKLLLEECLAMPCVVPSPVTQFSYQPIPAEWHTAFVDQLPLSLNEEEMDTSDMYSK